MSRPKEEEKNYFAYRSFTFKPKKKFAMIYDPCIPHDDDDISDG